MHGAVSASSMRVVTVLLAALAPAQDWHAELPSPRDWTATLVFDTARNHFVMVGRESQAQGLPDPADFVWEEAATRWFPIPTAHVPPQSIVTCAYDEARQRIVAMPWFAAETWEFDGVDWTQIAIAHPPLARGEATLVFDPVRQRVVLFGGNSTIGLRNDLWEYDGIDWYLVSVAGAPPARRSHGAAFDPVRQCMVVYGGVNTTFQRLTDTWELHGSVWTQVFPAQQPPTGPMTWNPATQRVALLSSNSLWSFDGAAWTSQPAPLPVTILPHMFANDPRTGDLVVVTDATANVPGTRYRWTGTSWLGTPQPYGQLSGSADLRRGETIVHSQTGVTMRRDAAGWTPLAGVGTVPSGSQRMVRDARGDRHLLVTDLSQTPTAPVALYEFAGTAWQLVPTPTAPPPRAEFAVALDPVRERLVLFGGAANGPYGRLDDTWEFDGTAWQQVLAAVRPPARSRHAMVFDTARCEIVLFGGDDGGATPFSDTWLYDANGWRQLLTAHAPLHGKSHGMANDPWRGRIVLHGGDPGHGTPSAETWSFDGSDWTQMVTGPATPARSDGLLVSDPAADTMVFVGGFEGSRYGAYGYANTWVLSPPPGPSAAPLGRGCPGSGGTPGLTALALPALGTTVPLQLASLPPQAGLAWLAFGFGIGEWNGSPLPLDLAAFGLPGCDLWIDAAPGLGVPMAHPGSAATHQLALPASPAFAGVHMAVQGVVLDPGVPAGLATSNAVLLVLQ